MSTYAELLKDPRWQKRRLEIFEREQWNCEACGDQESTLHVHHVVYIPGRKPWEYRDDLLQCFCQECHSFRQESIRKITDAIQIALKRVPNERLVNVSQRLFNEAMGELYE